MKHFTSPTGAAAASEPVTQDWVKHAVFYQIFPDRFAKSARVEKPSNVQDWDSDPTTHGYKGGDLLGVVERLDYLQELGITAIYFNPIFQSASNHRYHTHDYYQVDPLLGGNEAFDEMLAACHARGIRVVLDGVFNHASRGFFPFNDILENGAESPWVDWFTFGSHPANAYDHAKPPGYEAWIGLHALPKINTDHPIAREYLMRVGEYWVRKGIDGWRLDVPEEITTPGFWEEFRTRIKAIDPECYIVGEIWHEARAWLRGDQFDAVMNYPFNAAGIAFCGRHRVVKEAVTGRDYSPWPGIDGRQYAEQIDAILAMYPWSIQLAQLNLLDSHDTSRFLSATGDDVDSLKLAALLMFTFPGAPCVYYGDEIGLTGTLVGGDRWVRKSFPWDHPDRWDNDLLGFFKEVIALRSGHEVLRTGAYRGVHATEDTYAALRSLGGENVLTAVNTGDVTRDIDIARDGAAPGAPPRQLFVLNGPVTINASGDRLRLTMPPRSGVVLDLSGGDR